MTLKALLAVAVTLATAATNADAKQRHKAGDAHLAKAAEAIRKIESTNRYHVTANAGRGRTALGAYQILDTNLASWSREALGRSVSRSEFLGSKAIQDQIFNHKFSEYVRKYGSTHAAAKVWHGGPGALRNGGRSDAFGQTPDRYVGKFKSALN